MSNNSLKRKRIVEEKAIAKRLAILTPLSFVIFIITITMGGMFIYLIFGGIWLLLALKIIYDSYKLLAKGAYKKINANIWGLSITLYFPSLLGYILFVYVYFIALKPI